MIFGKYDWILFFQYMYGMILLLGIRLLLISLEQKRIIVEKLEYIQCASDDMVMHVKMCIHNHSNTVKRRILQQNYWKANFIFHGLCGKTKIFSDILSHRYPLTEQEQSIIYFGDNMNYFHSNSYFRVMVEVKETILKIKTQDFLKINILFQQIILSVIFIIQFNPFLLF